MSLHSAESEKAVPGDGLTFQTDSRACGDTALMCSSLHCAAGYAGDDFIR